MDTDSVVGKKQDIPKRQMKDILPSAFFWLKCCGAWQPFESASFLKAAYVVYMIFSIFNTALMVLSLFLVSLFSPENVKEAFIENSFLLLTLFNTLIKILVLLIRRKDIESVLHALLENHSQPWDFEEVEIQHEFDEEARMVTKMYAILVAFCIGAEYFPIVLIKDDNERIKVLNVWRPYELKVNLYFWITYAHQVIGYLSLAYLHLAVDVLISGLIMQLSCQLKFLCHRLKNVADLTKIIPKSSTLNFKIKKLNLEKSILSQIVVYHNIIYMLSGKVNRIFVEVIFVQFCLSLFVICFSLFKILRDNRLDSEMLIAILYICCMLTQLFLICWYGNELKLTSMNLADAIQETNWPFLEEESRRLLIILMIRCREPFIISATSLILVNLETFTSILKGAYSACNLLQQTV